MVPKGKTQKTLDNIVRPKVNALPLSDTDNPRDAVDLALSDPGLDASRSKRRRTSQHEFVEVGQSNDRASFPERRSSPQVVVPAPTRLPEPAAPVTTQTPPKKMLRLSGNGRFSSPVSKHDNKDDQQPSPEDAKRTGRSRKSRRSEAPQPLVVRLRFSVETGHRIDQILAGAERIILQKRPLASKPRTPKKPAKATHPFFLSKPKDLPPDSDPPRKATATTPGKLRAQVLSERPAEAKEVPYAVGSALLRDRLMVRHSGAREAPWPNGQQAHVRGLGDQQSAQLTFHTTELHGRSKLKRKRARLAIPLEESILYRFAAHLRPEQEPDVRPDGFQQPHTSLRLPERLLLSGLDVRRRIANQLSVPLSPDATQSAVPHPALQVLWIRLDGVTTHERQGETLSWTHKYAPTTSTTTLQSAGVMIMLKDWLMSLTVTAVETVGKAEAKTTQLKPRKKRRRKPNDLDDFLVDSDEEIHHMDELVDPEDVHPDKTHRSVVHVASVGARLSNAVLISGPHGSGKTAAAHAVAKELGFKVFEISPCERRSGKDVLDKVGNMTANHIVKHHGVDGGELSSSEDHNKATSNEELQRDLLSGRQEKMNTFFKPHQQKKKAARSTTLAAIENAIKKPAREQQQSLVLLEEVDILFRDDKDFWSTVLKLIATSKRPFIMTCSDEDMVPLCAMSLHAILRFTPPSLDLAVDCMLLISANEGHILQRDAVSTLYRVKNRDIRASIAELEFWCQTGVGDVRAGLTWIHQRWPPGSDVDEFGRKVRVVSDGTYQAGMGLLPDAGVSEEDKMTWAWWESGVDPTESLGWDGGATQPDVQGKCVRSLKRFVEFADTLSAVDVFTSHGLAETAPLDTTQPPLSQISRSQYIDGLPLLQADERIDYLRMSMKLAVGCTLTAWQNAVRHTNLHRETLQAGRQADRAQHLERRDFAIFNHISTSSESALSSTTSGGSPHSAFDGPLSIITTDLAPYVRSIAHYDLALEAQRERLNSLMADGGATKKARTTRAARSALEGNQRSNTRRERWFTKALDLPAVLATGGESWPRSTAESLEDEYPSSSAEPT